MNDRPSETTPGKPPYDIMSLSDLRDDREGVEFLLDNVAIDEKPHRRIQLAWYNAAIAWSITNGQ